MVARRPEARAVLEEFMATDMGAECRLLEPAEIGEPRRRAAQPRTLRRRSTVRTRSASSRARPSRKLAAFLAERHGVTFLRETVVHSAEPGRLETSRGSIAAGAVIVCPGDDFRTLHPERIARYGLTRCKLHMMRLAPESFRCRGCRL